MFLLPSSVVLNKGIDRSLVATNKDVSDGKYRLLFTAPEAVVEDYRWRMLLLEPPLNSSLVAIAVDEAHCVYKWQVINNSRCDYYVCSVGALTFVLPMHT